MQRRLLHAGAATSDIIHQYVSTIKALRDIDESGALLETVGEPIQAYLRSRHDTSYYIVSLLTEDSPAGGDSLLAELEGGMEGAAGATADQGDSRGRCNDREVTYLWHG